MAAAMNGMALHGGIVPYGGTFLVFSDYCRPAIRLSALMGQRVIYVLTHDSIGLGEDGPTHQPVEHLAALRAMPNLYVFRPADSVECAECWELALNAASTPSVLALTRRACRCCAPPIQAPISRQGRLCAERARGRARRDPDRHGLGGDARGCAAKQLAEEGVKAAVVSMPCFELFAAQGAQYQSEVLGRPPRRGRGRGTLRLVAMLGDRGAFIGMHGFGASAPAPELYKHFESPRRPWRPPRVIS